MDSELLPLCGTRRKPGRPRAHEPRATISTWIPATAHDQIVKRANASGQSVSGWVRQVLRRHLSGR